MLPHRKVLLLLCIVIVGGSLSSSLGYALYVRSGVYRHSVEEGVADYLRLPTDVGGVVPLSSRSRQFTGIKLWLPGRESQIFHCARAIWRAVQHNGESTNALDIHEGWFLLGTGEFSREDYQLMLRSGMGVDFSKLALSTLTLHDMAIVWRQPDFELQVTGTEGEVLFDGDGYGRAALVARTLNETEVSRPINIRALFTPGVSFQFHQVALEVPRIPLSSLALDGLLGTTITTGWFDGVLTYRQVDKQQLLSLRGAIGEARLEELTRQLPGGPLSGVVDINLNEATLTRERMLTLAFDGKLSDVHLGVLAPLLDQPDLEGHFDLAVHQARYEDDRLVYLNLSADAADVSMAAVTRLLGRGVITGMLRVTVNSLLIVDDAIVFGDIDLEVVPPDSGPGTISREAILFCATKALGLDLGRMADYLPETVEYARMGCKLLIDRDELTVHGSHGLDGQTILSVRLFGRELGVLRQPERPYPLADLIDLVRRRMEGYDVDRVRQWWGRRREAEGPGDQEN